MVTTTTHALCYLLYCAIILQIYVLNFQIGYNREQYPQWNIKRKLPTSKTHEMSGGTNEETAWIMELFPPWEQTGSLLISIILVSLLRSVWVRFSAAIQKAAKLWRNGNSKFSAVKFLSVVPRYVFPIRIQYIAWRILYEHVKIIFYAVIPFRLINIK